MRQKMHPSRVIVLGAAVALLAAAACDGRIYLRDGVTDGDTFYLGRQALTSSDPVLQSWVSYSLTRSACQLRIDGENPARATSFDCELVARRHLVESWNEHREGDQALSDDYLDQLARIHAAGFLAEYVAAEFSRRGWTMPAGLDRRAYRRWRRQHLPRHEPVTRLVGSWNYAREVDPALP